MWTVGAEANLLTGLGTLQDPRAPAPLLLKLDLSDVYQTGVSHLIPEIKKREAENKPDRLEAGSVRESADLECEEQI